MVDRAHRMAPRVGLISRSAALHSTIRLAHSLRRQGMRSFLVRPCQAAVVVGPEGNLFVDGAPYGTSLDFVIPRLGQDRDGQAAAMLAWFEAKGVPTLNCLGPIDAARDKFRSLQILSHAGVPVPSSALVGRKGSIVSAIAAVGGAPLLVKTRRGTHGVGVMLAESRAAARALIEHLLELGQPVFMQRFVPTEGKRDLRVVMLGRRVIGAMWRVLPEDDFRANVHRGAWVEEAHPGDEAFQLARTATDILGLEFAGVDLLRDSATGRWFVIEVNPTPGFRGLEEATGRNIADEIARYCSDKIEATSGSDVSKKTCPLAPPGQ